MPLVFKAISVNVERCLDLTDAEVLADIGVKLNQIRIETWWLSRARGEESLTQAIGRAAHACGMEVLVAVSADALDQSNNVIVLPDCLAKPAQAELADPTRPARDISESPQDQYARVAARYDSDNLYLAYSVRAPTNRMRNAGQDDHMLFKTGDCVDVMLQPESATKDQGAKRLLVSMIDNHPVAVLYEQGVPGIVAKDRVPFSSPWRTIYFDRVRRLSDVSITTHPQPGGYAVSVAVPWSDLGIVPSSGMKLKGDVGVLFADAGGTTTVSRKYWSNKATGLVNDVPGEAMLTPSLWGEFKLQ